MVNADCWYVLFVFAFCFVVVFNSRVLELFLLGAVVLLSSVQDFGISLRRIIFCAFRDLVGNSWKRLSPWRIRKFKVFVEILAAKYHRSLENDRTTGFLKPPEG